MSPRRRTLRSVLAWALFSAIVTYGEAAWAKPKTIAVYVEGPDARAVRDELATALPEGATLAESGGFSTALTGQGQSGPFNKKLDGATHASSVKRLASAASRSGADAVLVGRITKEKSGHRVRLLLVEASGDEAAVSDVVLDLKGDSHDDMQVASSVGPTLEKYKVSASIEAAAPAPEPVAAIAPAGETPARAPLDSAPDRPHGHAARSLLDLELGGEAAGRNFAYHDGITANLRSYNVVPAAMFTLNAEVFPLAGASGVLRDIGLVGAFSRSLFLSSSVSGGSGISTAETSYFAGVVVRIHPGGNDGPVISISDGYASQSFDFSGAGTLGSQVASVAYSANRTAVDARFPVGPFSFLVGAGFRAVFDAGQVAQRFRSSSVEGIDAEAGGALAVASGWEIRLIADYERYFYAFSPVPGDAYVAGGALDQFFGARLALAWIY